MNELSSLLKSHEFLRRALIDHKSDMPASVIADVESRIDQTFLAILKHNSSDARVTLAQVRFLFDSLIDQLPVETSTSALSTIGRRHLAALQQQFDERCTAVPLVHAEHRYLDSLDDRVVIIGNDYRYLFSNVANARFHALDRSQLIGRPNWDFAGEQFFSTVNKPRIDACMAGVRMSYVSAYPALNPHRFYAVSFDPVRDGNDRIIATIMVARNISDLPLQLGALQAVTFDG